MTKIVVTINDIFQTLLAYLICLNINYFIFTCLLRFFQINLFFYFKINIHNIYVYIYVKTYGKYFFEIITTQIKQRSKIQTK